MTTIQWTNETWNPIRARNIETGGIGHFCVKVDPACNECYAAAMQRRFKNPVRFAKQDQRLVDVFLDGDVVYQPLRWREPRMIFPCSMTDLFGDFVDDRWIDYVVAMAALTPRHTYQVLTKRHDRMLDYWTNLNLAVRIEGVLNDISSHPLIKADRAIDMIKVKAALRDRVLFPLSNWWQGVSAGTRETIGPRLTALLKAPVALRWLSAEPLLEEIDLTSVSGSLPWHPATHDKFNALHPYATRPIHWVVVGGESGQRARGTNVDHIRRVVRDCREHKVPVFVKQLGARPIIIGGDFPRLVDSKGGDPHEWPDDLRVREWPILQEAA